MYLCEELGSHPPYNRLVLCVNAVIKNQGTRATDSHSRHVAPRGGEGRGRVIRVYTTIQCLSSSLYVCRFRHIYFPRKLVHMSTAGIGTVLYDCSLFSLRTVIGSIAGVSPYN